MASSLLWAHLLRKDATSTDSPSQIPPIAPQDKTGTSMRMLIHDTQVNLEKFSTRLDGLLQRVDDCRIQIVNATKLLDVERDKVLTEILGIANRCQTEMKAHVGTPAQAPALDLVRVSQASTEKSVQALEKRIDALQALLQTHAHAMQSIQDQQNSLMGAVLPLVPIIHGVPPQMDQVKAALSDMVANAVSTMTKSVEGVRSTLFAEFAHGRGCAGSSTRIGSSSESMSSSQRKRSNASVLGPQEINVPASSPLDSRSHGEHHLSLKRARIEGAMYHAGDAQFPRKLSRLAVPLTNSGDTPRVQTPRTPRQPLSDLLLAPRSNTPRTRDHVTNHLNCTSHGYMRRLETLRAPGGPLTIPTAKSRPPLRPLEHACSDLRDPTIKIEEVEVDLAGVFSISPSSRPLSVSLPTRHKPNETSVNMAQPSTQQPLQLQDNVSDVPQVDLVQVPPPLSDPFSSNPDTSPPKSMSLRDRRAQMSRFGCTQTRRFIPLVPWSDEEE